MNGFPIAIMSPSSINNMVTNERFVFFRHDDTNNSVANQSILEDNESAEELGEVDMKQSQWSVHGGGSSGGMATFAREEGRTQS